MSSNSVLVMASVTAVLKSLLDNELVRRFASTPVGDFTISALPPDRVKLGEEERAGLNLYLYRVTPNSGRYHNGRLAVDLHYLLSAYGERDLQAEVLLGSAMQCFQQSSVLTQEELRSMLTAISSTNSSGGPNPILEVLATSTLAEQLHPLKITPEFLSMEDLSRLWTSLQAHARVSMTYMVSLVLLGDNPDGAVETQRAQLVMR